MKIKDHIDTDGRSFKEQKQDELIHIRRARVAMGYEPQADESRFVGVAGKNTSRKEIAIYIIAAIAAILFLVFSILAG
ncbi:MAG: hypothetical protein PVI92_09610 [Chromatiales bacterium]|jgi:hypothetical protein